MSDADDLNRLETLRAQELLRIIDFGLQVQQFLRSEIGTRMVNDANAECDELRAALVDCDIDTEEGRIENRRLRLRHAVLTQWQAFLLEYVQAGTTAEHQYQEGERAVEPTTDE